MNQEQSSMSNSADTGAPTAAAIAAAGITYPPIDELLTRTSSKYGLSIYAAKRARQINDYYAQLGEGLLEYVGPLVEPLPKEKPLSIALREINAGLLTHTDIRGPNKPNPANPILIHRPSRAPAHNPALIHWPPMDQH
jgi:DNA-directed RNA polymerase subunit omega